MAGLGRKTFIATEVLTAANVNGYLMDQSVMKFASSAARSSAIGTAVSEGMVSYLADTDALEVYNGTSWGAVSSSSSGNAIINGAFDIWQRGTSFSAVGSSYTADRWYKGASTAQTTSRQATSDSTNLPNIQYCARLQRVAASTSTVNVDFGSPMETVNSIPFAGKTVTLSYYARSGANFSAASSVIRAALFTGTGTDQNGFSGYTGNATPIDTTVTLTTTWQRFQHTTTLASSVTEIMPYFGYAPVGTAGAADYFEITGVQLEANSSATSFKRNASNIQGELAACQRYYWRATTTGNASGVLSLTGIGQSSTNAQVPFKFPETMRAAPTAIDYGGAVRLVDGSNSYNLTSPTMTMANQSIDGVFVNTTGASGLTQYRPYTLIDQFTGTGYVGFSAEI